MGYSMFNKSRLLLRLWQFTDRDYLWPITFTQIDLNSNLEQNQVIECHE